MQRWLPIALILALIIGFRALGSAYPDTLPNFQPLAALFFCGAWLIAGWRGLALPLTLWFLTYPLPAIFLGNTSYLLPELATLIAFIATWAIGFRMRAAGPRTLLVGSLAAALTFHLITNGAAWLASPLYPKSPLGLWQSLWAGPVGAPLPSWIFLRNSLAANLVFTALILAARWHLPARSPAPLPTAANPAR